MIAVRRKKHTWIRNTCIILGALGIMAAVVVGKGYINELMDELVNLETEQDA